MDGYILDELKKAGYPELSISHGMILINFHNKDVMNYKELSKRISKSPQTMTTLVRKLEQSGYILLQVDKFDKRNKLVSLTNKGKDFIPVMMTISKNLYKKQYVGFSQEEQTIIKQLLAKLEENFKEQ